MSTKKARQKSVLLVYSHVFDNSYYFIAIAGYLITVIILLLSILVYTPLGSLTESKWQGERAPGGNAR